MKKPVIRLSFDKFKHYVKSAPRNYTIVVMLTALNPARECQICRPANEEYQIVAQSWRYSAQFNNRLFFAMVDFDEASDVFKMLNTASAPQFIIFGRKGKPKAADNLDLPRVGFSAETIAKWITERTDIQVKVFRPPNYSGLLLVVLLILMIGGLLYVKRNNLEFLYNKTTWSMIIIVSTSFFSSFFFQAIESYVKFICFVFFFLRVLFLFLFLDKCGIKFVARHSFIAISKPDKSAFSPVAMDTNS